MARDLLHQRDASHRPGESGKFNWIEFKGFKKPSSQLATIGDDDNDDDVKSIHRSTLTAMLLRASAIYWDDSLEPNMKCWEQIIVHNKHNATIKDYLVLSNNNKKHIQFSMWQYQCSGYRWNINKQGFTELQCKSKVYLLIHFQQSICSIWLLLLINETYVQLNTKCFRLHCKAIQWGVVNMQFVTYSKAYVP